MTIMPYLQGHGMGELSNWNSQQDTSKDTAYQESTMEQRRSNRYTGWVDVTLVTAAAWQHLAGQWPCSLFACHRLTRSLFKEVQRHLADCAA
jgi:hypothetical protein